MEKSSPRLGTPAAQERGRRTSSTMGEPLHVRFALDAAEVREFVVKSDDMKASQVNTGYEDTNIGDDSPRVYKRALRERIRAARHQAVPDNEARALRRARCLRRSLETCDEKHLGFSSKRLAYLRDFFAATGATSRTLDLHPDIEPEPPGWTGLAVEGGPSYENAKKSKIGVVWRSLSISCSRAAQFTSKGISNVRRKMWCREASSKDAAHGGTQGLSFTRWQKRDNVCAVRAHSFASIVPHDEV
eukprot:TRINITY_DN14987_c1_g1_i1.p1 TRINITY_DN14987_c1_g1~~TRINITY_DN14987_c1_g1_i1.p1  ORF type:complete len:245 (-),score=25.62 TRINITY_DN14987_c1_g1_i1:266-1000(-)